jgi:hypothetical protein
MTATTTPASNHDLILGAPTTSPRLLVPGLIAGAIAAAATSATVLVAHAAGVAVAVGGQQIPVAGFAQFVLVGALIGIALARAFSRRASRPRSTFVRTTVVLTAMSIVPDLLVQASSGSKLVLALTHLIAAAIIIPTLAARLPRNA